MGRAPGTLDIVESGTPTKRADTDQLIRTVGGNPTMVQREVVSIGSPEIGEEENIVRPNADGSVPVTAAALPLPAGASTEATLVGIKGQTDKLAFNGDKLKVDAVVTGAGDGAILDGVNAAIRATVTGANALKVDGSGVTQPVSDPLTDAQLRATPVPVSGPLTDAQLRATAVPVATGLTQPTTPADTQPISAAALPLPAGASTEATLALIKAKTDNLDVALSSRTKPADQQHTIIDSSALPTGAATEATLALVKAKTDNLDVALSTRTKPSDQQHAIVDSSALPTGASTEATLAAIKADVDKIPASPAQEHAIAASPASVRLSDGVAFIGPTNKLPVDASGSTGLSISGSVAVTPFSPPWVIGGRRLNTYAAIYRLATRPYALSNVFAAAGRKQYATLFHPSAVLKDVRLRKVLVALESSSAAAIVTADLVRLTSSPLTGNPVITPSPFNNGIVTSTAFALPTTGGAEGAVLASHEWNVGITGSAPTTNPPPGINWIDLLCQDQSRGPEGLEEDCVTIHSGILEGFAVVIDVSAATTVKAHVKIVFTEEP